ncbi:Elongator complex protein 1-like protein [Elsinoe fawcettii]|nr:Elongator complex protein 1-like protein [Elsinoe fawcettii]
MRNLRNIRHTAITFDETNLPLTATAWDADTDGVVCAFGPAEHEAVIELKRFDKDAFKPEDGKLIASWDAPCPLPELKCDKILAARYFAESQSTCLILAGGDLIVVRENAQPGEDMIEIVGSVDAGITAASWSPDEELVAISTRANTFIFMTRMFEGTANVQMTPDDVKVSAHVSVGWGKSETQFKGKRAKALRDPTMPEHIDEGVLSRYDVGETTISWRGDGAYVAINTIEESKRRMIRIYSREGVLESVSEPVDGLEGALSWRPAGNLMAGIQYRKDGSVFVLFFERNGLRHGDFPLRFHDQAGSRPDWAQHISLEWNNDSTVLAVSFRDRVQLWTMGNYHYYLKQEILFLAQADPVAINWHSEKALYLTACSRSDFRHLNYTINVSGGTTAPPHDYGLAAVLDGRSLKLTPLRIANVPPPMSFVDVDLIDNATDVACNRASTMIGVLYVSKVQLFKLDLLGTNPSDVAPFKILDLPVSDVRPMQPRQLTITGDDQIVVLASTANESIDTIYTLKSDLREEFPIPGPEGSVLTLSTPTDHSSIFLQTSAYHKSQTTISTATVIDGSLSLRRLTTLPLICPRIEVWKEDDTSLVVGLSAGGALHVLGRSAGEQTFSQRLQVKGITSFMTTPSHLIFTTSQHLIKFVHLHDGELEVPLDEPEKDERCRSIERGARLISVMPSAYAVVLQMPRGNLETIFPRALVLAGIRKAIIAKDYRKAFFACRNHRVDMNILHDYNPKQFMTNVDLFVDQLKKPTHIDLFLSQLRDEDVTHTLYKETLNAPKLGLPTSSPPPTPLNKTNTICSAFITALSPSSRRKTHLQSLITSHVCKTPPDLASGLQLISSLRSASDPAALEQGIEHICFLSDANRLYDTALGLYDLDTALLVAQHAQKDPREYLPYLQSLQELPDLRRRFTVDNDLKRFGKALGSLIGLGKEGWEEAKRYAVRHELYAELVEGVKYDKEKSAEGMWLWAEFLGGRNRYKEAGIAWEGLGEWGRASEQYLAAGLWRECLASAALAGKEEREMEVLVTGLAEGKEEAKEYGDAALLWRELGDREGEVRCWCKGYRFAEAVMVVGKSKGDERKLLLGKVDDGLAEGFASMSEVLAEMKTQVAAQRGRLEELRKKKREDPLGFYDGAPASGNPDIPDDISLAPSMTSTSAGTFMTRYTNRTTSTLATNTTRRSSKNRRREERKKARGKKGSVYEEEYLVSSIGRLVERLNSMSEEVQRLIEGLMRRGMRERGVAVQNLIKEVIEAANAALPEVFEVVTAGQQHAGTEDQEQELVQQRKEVPLVKAFEGLSLLG